MKLLLATYNRGKIREIAGMLEGFPIETIALGEFKGIVPACETGKTFAANAKIKARTYFEQTGLLTFSEDSGLEVDHLGGAPGCLSADSRVKTAPTAIMSESFSDYCAA